MAAAYRSAIHDIKTEEQREMIRALTTWLDGFLPWAQVAASLGRPVPDLVGFGPASSRRAAAEPDTGREGGVAPPCSMDDRAEHDTLSSRAREAVRSARPARAARSD